MDDEGELMGSRVLYATDGRGNWTRTEWKPQCRAKVFLKGECQGTTGHKGVHWHYGPSGSFEWQRNRNDPTEKYDSGSTPPGHRDYPTPESMREHYYISYYTRKKVTDKATIAMLEKGKTPERGASLTRPI